jgi:carbon-monoxide dehydrogenase small subunit
LFEHRRDAARACLQQKANPLQKLPVDNDLEKANDARALWERREEELMTKVTLTVNGRTVSGECEDRTLLVHFIRDKLGLTGTHVGCDTTQCGACVIHMDGHSVKSCSILAVQASGSTVTTIEGLSAQGELHPVQAAFKEHHGLQCGFCTPGMVMTAVDMISRLGGSLTEEVVRSQLEGNICRCTGYHNIIKAILAADADMASARQAAE